MANWAVRMRTEWEEYVSGLEDLVKGVVIIETEGTQGRSFISVEVGMEETINSVLLFLAHHAKTFNSQQDVQISLRDENLPTKCRFDS